jgi:hypothetical protein
MGERLRLRGSGLEWRRVEDDVVALDLPTETYLGLNQSAAALWEVLADGASQDELIQLLIDRYAIDRLDAERDVGEFISALQARGMLESIPE